LKLDRYIKKLQTIQLILILIYGQIQQQKSLPVLVNNLNNQDFCKAINLISISVSHLSRRLNHLPSKVLHLLFQESVLLLYRYRWQIELFFKWIKQHFSVKRFYATSPNDVENQIYIELIAYCLLQLLKIETECLKSLLEMTRVLTACIDESYDEFVQKLHFKSSQTSKGRRKIDFKTEYLIIERQVLDALNPSHI
jgi:hypothetical protein